MISSKERQLMQERGLGILISEPEGFKFSPTFFAYTSSQIGPYYVQSGVVQNRPQFFETALGDMAALIKGTVGDDKDYVISGGETRDWIFSIPLAHMLKLPHVMLYKDGKTVGASMKDRRVIHVADLNNEGSSPRDLWIPTIKREGGLIENIFFYVDRKEDGDQVMKDLNLRSEAVVPLDENAWNFLRDRKEITLPIHENLVARGYTTDSRHKWAIDMLNSQPGLETLAALLMSAKTKGKGIGILNKGYPEAKDEIIHGLVNLYGKSIVERL